MDTGDAVTDNRKTDVWSRFYILVLAIVLMGMMSGSFVVPVLSTLMETFQVGKERIGQVIAVYTLFVALTMPFLSPLMDKLGRKQVVVPCLIPPQ